MLPAQAPQPFQPSRQLSRWRRMVWLLPMLLALVFVALIVYWAEVNDAEERAAFHNTLVADAQSVVAQISGRQDMERAKLREVARRLASASAGDATLRALPEVVAGLDRLWNRLVWIDENKRLLARAGRDAPNFVSASDELRVQAAAGQADHFVVPVPGAGGAVAGELLARYEMTDLLKSTDLSWLNHRYQVDFLSELGEVIASTAQPGRPAAGARFEVPLAEFRDTTLRLTPFQAEQVWHKNSRTLTLLAALLLLGAAASELLRREMRRVARAVQAANTEAAWRQAMQDSALVGLRARDLQGRILYVNKTLCELVGYAPEELVGQVPPLPFWPPEATEAMMARNQDTLDGKASADGFESRWQHRDGHLVDVMVFEAALLDSAGAQIGWMGSIVDISARKQLEEKERRHLEHMAQQARLNDLGLIASELAHEINQPLATIASYSAGLQLALQRQQPAPADLLSAADAIVRNASKAGEIVHWIRRQSSRAEPVLQAADLNLLAQAALSQRSAQWSRQQIAFHVALDAELPRLRLDQTGIEQLISNLLRNAAEALAEVPGERAIWLSSRYLPPMVELSVRDNGPGLQGRSFDTLCSTFYSTKAQGMGLGLGICRAIAEAHGGTLSASDAVAGGAEFCLRLPAGPGAAI